MQLRIHSSSGSRVVALSDTDGPLIAGRDVAASIHLPDPDRLLSRQHLRLRAAGTRVDIEVISTSSGATTRHGPLEPGQSAQLAIGDFVKLGGYTLTVEQSTAAAATPAAPRSPLTSPSTGSLEAVFGSGSVSSAARLDPMWRAPPALEPFPNAIESQGHWMGLPARPMRESFSGHQVADSGAALAAPEGFNFAPGGAPNAGRDAVDAVNAFLGDTASKSPPAPRQGFPPPLSPLAVDPIGPLLIVPVPRRAEAETAWPVQPGAAASPEGIDWGRLARQAEEEKARRTSPPALPVSAACVAAADAPALQPAAALTPEPPPMAARPAPGVDIMAVFNSPDGFSDPVPSIAPPAQPMPWAPPPVSPPSLPWAHPADLRAQADRGSSAQARAHLPQPESGSPDTAAIDVQAFAKGLGIALPGAITTQDCERLGATLRQLVDGLGQLMAARASLKNELRASDKTEMWLRDNNPFKAGFDVDALLQLLFFDTADSGKYKGAEQAVRESVEDLLTHDLAILGASRACVEGIVRDFAPERLRLRLPKGPKSLLDLGQDGRMWRDYSADYGKRSLHMADWLDRIYEEHFVAAYSREAIRLSQQHISLP